MKKWIGIFLALSIAACTPYTGYKPPSLGELGVPILSSEEEIIEWIDANITYLSDEEQYGYTEYIASMEELMGSRKGDCEEFANLFLVMVKQNLGEAGEFHIYENKARNKAHAVGVVGRWRYYDVNGYDVLVYSFSYEAAMNRIGTRWKRGSSPRDNRYKETGI